MAKAKTRVGLDVHLISSKDSRDHANAASTVDAAVAQAATG